MTVTVYSLPISQCVRCRGVEIAMGRSNIQYQKVMLNEDSEAYDYVKRLGYDSAPVTVVTEGDEVLDHWSGLYVDRIKELAKDVA